MIAQEAKASLDAGAVVLDLRPPRAFAAGHLPAAINLQFNRADLADRAEMVLPKTLELIVHAEPEPVARVAQMILEKAGFKVSGHLEGGLKGWREASLPVETLPVIDVDALHERLNRYVVIDARDPFEYRHGHITGATTLPSIQAWQNAEDVPRHRPLAVYCGDQVRSSLVASVLRRHGHDTTLVMGGMVDWLERGYPVEKVPAHASFG